MPKDVGPVRWHNPIVGTCLLVISAVLALPVGLAIYHDGFASVLRWPALFNWLSAFAALALGLGLYLLATPQRVGGWVTFREGGFSIRIRHLILKGQDHDVDWANVAKVELVKAPRNQDGLTLTLTHGPLISFRDDYFEFGVDEILARLTVSAEAAGYRLERLSGVNALVFEKQTRSVVPRS